MSEVAVVYLGDFAQVDRRFPEKNLSFRFVRGVPRMLPRDVAALFEPNRNWIVGEYDAEQVARAAGRRHVVLRRAVALGDVIAAHGAAMAFKRREPQTLLSLQTSPLYMPMFVHDDRYFSVLSTTERVMTVPIDRIVNMDGLFELDHNPQNEKVSRVLKTMRHFYRDETSVIPELKPDFSIRLSESDRAWALEFLHKRGLDVETRRGRKLVACGTRSVQPQRALAPGMVRSFCDAVVAELGADVLLIEPDPAHSWKADRQHPAVGTSITQALALLEHCDASCSMDSGLMWMAHCFSTPMLVWLGPTPAETKVNYHPLYPHAVRVIALNEWIDCPACYEHAERCSFTFECLRKPDRSRFVADSVQALRELLAYAPQAIKAPGA